MTVLLNEREVAQRLGVSHRSLQKWRITGAGPAFVKVAGAVRYRPEDIEDFVAAGRRTSTSDPGPAAL